MNLVTGGQWKTSELEQSVGWGNKKTVVPLQKFNLHAPDSVSIISADTTSTDTDSASIPASTIVFLLLSLCLRLSVPLGSLNKKQLLAMDSNWK